ncbi:hypothetical protein BpHYR1_016421 [Brachionus plicatilis]|uniref:Uncharacterized protein n=1 Tax=Brachionus plicatilis TaxID=10195 RepID=A0A3M7T243_BRAPC|nr:hypothetical protein BpHYR1_016421 [Brachionus plicatilis]
MHAILCKTYYCGIEKDIKNFDLIRDKLVAYGFCPGIVDWVSDFFLRRQQRVVMGHIPHQ